MLNDFIKKFSSTYQEVFQKVTVAMEVANKRFESDLTFGQTVTRFTVDENAVRVRDVADDYADRTIDALTDGNELLTINKQKSANFKISRKQKIQAGPLGPVAKYGGIVAKKMGIAVDADVLAETSNAHATFDAGDVASGTSNGTPIQLSAANLNSVLTKLRAKLRRNNIGLENTVFVADSFMTAVVEDSRLGKEISAAETTFRNGFAGPVLSSGWFNSENLTGEAVISAATNPANGQSVTIGGVVFELGANVTRGADKAATMNAIADVINDPSSLPEADQIVIEDTLGLSASVNDDDELVVKGIGSGRLNVAVSDSFVKESNFIHAYFGKRKAIDLVLQDKLDMFETQEPKKPVKNYLTEYVYGVKTFADGSEKFIDLWIDADVI